MDRTEFARHLRKTSNTYEQLMWQLLRNRKRCGMKFRRQHPIGIYTADFYCPNAKLNIEIDGVAHFTNDGQQRDAARDRYMAEQGIRVLRFTGKQVELETELLLKSIDNALIATDDPHPQPLSPNTGRGE